MASNSKKLCYILPEYDEKTATHFAHIYDFLEEIEKEFELYVVVEKGSFRDPQDSVLLNKTESCMLSFSFFPLRVWETLVILLKLRIKGYRDFYVHYSFLSAFLTSIIIRIFGGRVFYWNCGEPWKYKRNILRGTLEKFTYKIITYLVTGTEGLKREYARQYKLPLDKIKVMPNWINLTIYNLQSTTYNRQLLRNPLKIKEDERVILFVHRLSKRKGAHYLPEIIKEFKNEKVVFTVIGDGPERSGLELGIRNYELGDKVRLLGWVPNNELLKYYAIADVFLMPSDEEGFPRVLLEAMATKVPFVASDVGGVKEIIPELFSSYICNSGDVDCFTSKIKKLLSLSQEEQFAIAEAEYLRVKKYDIYAVAEQFRALFE